MNKLISQSFFDRPAYQVCPELGKIFGLSEVSLDDYRDWGVWRGRGLGFSCETWSDEAQCSGCSEKLDIDTSTWFTECTFQDAQYNHWARQWTRRNLDKMNKNDFPGPGKLTKHLEISQQTNAQPATKKLDFGLKIEE